MKDSLILQDKKYISAKRAHELFGYSTDYVGQLCRAGKLDCKMVGRSWFVEEQSIIQYRLSVADGTNTNTTNTNIPQIDHVALSQEIKKAISEKSAPQTKEDSQSVFNKKEKIIINKPEEVFSFESLKDSLKNLPPKSKIENNVYVQKDLGEKPIKNISVFNKKENFKSKKIIHASLVIILLIIIPFVAGYTNNPKQFSINNFYKKINPVSSESLASLSSISSSIYSEIINIYSVGLHNFSSFVVNIIDDGYSVFHRDMATNTVKTKFNGIAVVPSTNSETEDNIMKQKIRDSFSDEIQIKPDQSGTAGVITPVFKKAKGDDFVYVLVPVNDNK